jgi:hypothetical protein
MNFGYGDAQSKKQIEAWMKQNGLSQLPPEVLAQMQRQGQMIPPVATAGDSISNDDDEDEVA